MAIRSGLFDSTETVETINGFPRGNKAQTADFFAAYFASFVGNGIHFTPSTCFQVLTQSGMAVQIRPGRCFIQGYFAIDEEAEIKTFAKSGTTHSYWLVLRLDLADGSINKVWVTDPAPDELPVRSGAIYDLVIAKVSVGANVSTITEAMITDYRSNTEYCGYIKSLVDGIGATVEYAATAGELSAAAMAALLHTAGGTMTGPLTLSGNPAALLHAVPKQYVDSRTPQLTELVRFTTSGTFKASDYPSADDRYMIMLLGAGGGGYYDSPNDTYLRAGGAGAMHFFNLLLDQSMRETAFAVIIGAAGIVSDGGSTKFGGLTSPGGEKAETKTRNGLGGSTGLFTAESGRPDGGGNSFYGTGATETAAASGYGAGGYKDKPGSNGLVIVYGYR